MSITLDNAKKIISLFEEIINNPEEALDLIQNGIDDLNFLYQIEIDDKHIIDYIKDCLSSLPAFEGCILKNESSYNIKVYVPALNPVCDNFFYTDDLIINIDLCSREFEICKNAINDYERIINAKYKYKEIELDDFWKQFLDTSFKNRCKYIKTIWKTKNSKLKNKILETYFWLVQIETRNKLIIEKFNEELENIEKQNKRNKKEYDTNIAIQKYYQKHAKTHIQKIKDKQNKIKNFLIEKGYEELE